MADGIMAVATLEHEPLRHQRLTPSWQGGKMTNTEARRIVADLRGWARQFNHEDARNLDAALEDIEALFVCVWTEIDESLTRILLAGEDHADREKHIAVALSYLHRWQDRGGRVGNAEPLDESSHA